MSQTNIKPLITLVVPVYNVEEYLNECVDSVVNQTYSNLEIILVDDGSTDQSPVICDEYALKDNRIHVIHQHNGGLSAARNIGIENAHGEYISFLDSDDYLSPDAIESMYNTLIENDAQISAIGYQSFCNGIEIKEKRLPNELYKWSKVEVLDSFLFNGYLNPCACGKLFKMNLWNELRFPVGKLFEDQFTVYKVIDRCLNIVFQPEGKYHYRKRANSIGHSKFSKKTYDLYNAINEEYEYISSNYPYDCKNISVARITWEVVFVNMMINSDFNDIEIRKKVQNYARLKLNDVFNCPFISSLRKGQIFLFAHGYLLYTVLYRLYKKKNPLS